MNVKQSPIASKTPALPGLRQCVVTQREFDRLPALLTAFQVRLVTGLSDHELADAVRAKQLKVWYRPVRQGSKRSYAKYLKVSVAEMVGMKV